MWTVTYKHATGNTTICHGLDNIGQTGYYTGPLGDADITETEWAVDPIKPIGAAHAVPADRGCGMHTFPLWVERRFDTEADARIFAKGFAGTLPRFGVSLEITDTTAGKIITYATAVLQKLIVSRNGRSVDFHFTFQTSVPVTTNIPAPEPEE